jgi:hypothetical protein
VWVRKEESKQEGGRKFFIRAAATGGEIRISGDAKRANGGAKLADPVPGQQT